MRIAGLLAAAGLAVAALSPATDADAQARYGDRYQGRDGGDVDGYRRDRESHADRHHDRGHRRCRIEVRHHHRARACR